MCTTRLSVYPITIYPCIYLLVYVFVCIYVYFQIRSILYLCINVSMFVIFQAGQAYSLIRLIFSCHCKLVLSYYLFLATDTVGYIRDCAPPLPAPAPTEMQC